MECTAMYLGVFSKNVAYRRLPAKMANLSFGAKTGFYIFAKVKTARFSRKEFQGPIQSAYKVIPM